MTTSSIAGTSSNPFSAIVANSTVATSTAASSIGASSSSASSAASAQNLSQTFLQLLVAQMNNQDPLNPVDNTQLTTQLAQISTVTGISNLNSSIGGLLSQLQQSSAIQSAQLTGHSVMVAGSQLQLASNTNAAGASAGENAVGGFNLSGAASQVTVTIQDASGATVRTMQLGPQSAGFQDFTWDGSTDAGGTAATGAYQFKVDAVSSTGAAVAASPYKLMQVVGTVPQAGGSPTLMLNDGTQVPYGSVAQFI